jgi:TolB-like protein
MSRAGSAVFLSYASQDAGAARRIATALRDAGVEVWFDRSELRGGDAWDASIRRQIKECALFVPLISAHTQARLEGYFRLEWHLAEQRTFLMAHDAPFLFPVVIDGTDGDSARVPDKFRERQWATVTDSESAGVFAARIRAVLSNEDAVAPDSGAARDRPAEGRRSNTSRRWRNLAVAAVVGMGVVFGLQFLLEPSRDDSSSVARPASTDERPYYAGSVAVLPFRVPDGDPGLGAAAASLHEELLVQLGEIGPLDVVSRTSSLLYRDSDRSIRDIGRELGADFVVEGSVHGSGSPPGVILQVVEAATDRTIFSETFANDFGDSGSPAVASKLRAWEMAFEIYRRVTAAHPPEAAAAERLERVVSALQEESEQREVRFWGNDGQPRDYSQFNRLVEIAREIIAIDPENVTAHRDLALFLSQNPAGGLDELLLVLRRGLHLDPDDFEILRHMGTFYLLYRGPCTTIPNSSKNIS